MNYMLDSDNYNGTVEMDLKDGFCFSPKIECDIKIKEIILYDEDLINYFIYNRFLKKYKKLVTLVIKILSEESTDDSGIRIALDEIEKQKEIISTKYHKYLKQVEEKKYLRKLEYLEMELKNKILINSLNIHHMYDFENEQKNGKSR